MSWNKNKIVVQYKFESDIKSVVYQLYKMPIDLDFDYFAQQNTYLETIHSIPKNHRKLYSLYNQDTSLYIVDTKDIKKDVIYIMKNVTGDVDYYLDTINEYLSIISGGGTLNNNSKIMMKNGELRDYRIIGYKLKNHLAVPQFANQFLLKEGIIKFYNFIDSTKLNVQAYAYEAFKILLKFMNSCQFVEENDNLFFSFYKLLIKNKEIVNSTKNLLAVFYQIQLYFTIINTPEKFYDYFYKAAEKYSREFGQKVLEPFVSLVKDKSCDVKEYFMILVVEMLENYSKKKTNTISSDLKKAGIIEALSLRDNVECKYSNFQKMLTKYQEKTKEIIKGSAYELETYKHKIKQYQKLYQEYNKKVEIAAHKQNYYDEIVDDFLYFKKMNEACIETEGYYDPYTPVCRYDKRELVQHLVDEKSKDKLKKLAEEESENPDEVRKLQKNMDLLKDKINNYEEDNNNKINEFKKYQVQPVNNRAQHVNDRDDLKEENEVLLNNEFCLYEKLKLEELDLDTNTNTLSQHAQLVQNRIKLIISQIDEAQNTEPISFNEQSNTTISTFNTNQSSVPTNPPNVSTEAKNDTTTNTKSSTVPPIPNSIPPVPTQGQTISSVPLPPPLSGIPQPPQLNGVPSVPKVPGAPQVPGVPSVPGVIAPPPKVVKPTKKEIKLPAKVKNLGWKRVLLDESLNKTIWKLLKEPEVKIEDIVNLFGIKSTTKPMETEIKKKVSERVTFLNPKRTQSVGITIAKLPPVSEVAIALEEMDDTLITESNIEALNREYLTPEEIEEYKKYKDPRTKFGRAEEYLIGLYIIKNSKQKLEIWEFLNHFSEEYDNISEMIEYNEKAIDLLAKNKFIPILFSYILSVGNILNGGTNRGQADGFNIEVLTKLNNIRDKNNHSVLQFVCTKIKEDNPDFENLSQKFICVKEAFGYPFIDMQKNWNTFKKGFPKIQSFYDALPNDRFKKTASKQIDNAKKQIEKINKSVEKIQKKYTDLVNFFGITEKEVYYNQPERLFKLFTLFFEDVDNAIPKPQGEKKVFKPKFKIEEKVCY